MIVSIHQPEHLPWLGFFHKMSQSDNFVLLDNVPYRKNYFQNRNRIRTRDGFCWVTVPVLHKGRSSELIKDVEINLCDHKWARKIWRSIYQNYHRAPFFSNYGPYLEALYLGRKWQKLVDLNVALTMAITGWLGIKTPLFLASELKAAGTATNLLLAICQELKGDTYLSGKFGKDYLDEGKFREARIKIVYHAFAHPTYFQLYHPFLPHMSSIDLLMNHGEESLRILSKGNQSGQKNG